MTAIPSTARKAGRQALVILGLIAAGFAGLLAAEGLLAWITSLGVAPGGWRAAVLRGLGVFVALAVFWVAYGFPRDMWRPWRASRERQS